MENKKYPHADHRRRVREAFIKGGTAHIPDRGLLELILFYAIPRRDTNALATSLIEKYGSLKGVSEAGYDDLIKEEGIGESAALLLSTLPEISKRCGKEAKSLRAICEPGQAQAFVKDLFKDTENEEFIMICIDASGRSTACVKLAQGDKTGVVIDKKEMLRAAIESDAESVIFAHNHPGGEAAPSAADIELTLDASRLLAETGIRLEDHIIAGADECLSLASTAKFAYIFR